MTTFHPAQWTLTEYPRHGAFITLTDPADGRGTDLLALMVGAGAISQEGSHPAMTTILPVLFHLYAENTDREAQAFRCAHWLGYRTGQKNRTYYRTGRCAG